MTASAVPGNPAEPPTPPGPGVEPPFAAPPTQRDPKKLWIGLGIGALAVVLCCAGGIFGFGVLVAGTVKETEIGARQLAADYLGALKDEDYPAAYRLLCGDITGRQSARAFAREASRDPVVGFTIGELVNDPSELVVRASVRYTRQGTRSREYIITSGLDGLAICGER
ncbi:MAG: hypothetical protein HKP61_04375 [Dactylosporangium sp.]|nr:hypothetical protein [Dactylosporangium sp.]NNJ60189.1 hypothetical protein [Dactylosporangium sp.]